MVLLNLLLEKDDFLVSVFNAHRGNPKTSWGSHYAFYIASFATDALLKENFFLSKITVTSHSRARFC